MTFYGSKVKLPLTDATFRNITLDILDKNKKINDQCLDVSFNVYRMREVCICKAFLTNTKKQFSKVNHADHAKLLRKATNTATFCCFKLKPP